MPMPSVVMARGTRNQTTAQKVPGYVMELDIPLNTPEGQILLGARDVIAEEAFAAESLTQ